MKTKEIKGKVKKTISGIAKDLGTYGLVLAIGFILLGIYGMILALGITVVAPACMAMAGAGYQTGDKKWGDLGKGQKAGIMGFLVFLAPFILGAIMWLVLTSVSYWIDTIVIITILCIGGYVYFYMRGRGSDIKWVHTSMLFLGLNVEKTEKNGKKGVVQKVFSSKVVLIIGVILALVLLVGTTYNTASEYTPMRENSPDKNTVLAPTLPPPSNGNETEVMDEIPPDELTEENINLVNYTHVYIGVYDTFLMRDETTRTAYSIIPNTQQEIGIDGTVDLIGAIDFNHAYPLSNVKITVEASIVDYDSMTESALRPILLETNRNGLAILRTASAGVYDIKIEKVGYQTLNAEIIVTEEYIDSTRERMLWKPTQEAVALRDTTNIGDYRFALMPSYYELTLTYMAFEERELVTVYNNDMEDMISGRTENYVGTPNYVNYDSQLYDAVTNLPVVGGVVEGIDSMTGGALSWIGANNPLQFAYTTLTGGVETEVYNYSYYVVIKAEVNNGMYVKDLRIIERQDNLYGFTGLPVIGGNQMFSLKNQMQSMTNSYFSGMQTVLPSIQHSVGGGGGRVREHVYMGHRFRELPVAQEAGMPTPTVMQIPSFNDMWSNGTQTRNIVGSKSTLDYVMYRFQVIGGGSVTNLAFQFETTFRTTSATETIALALQQAGLSWVRDYRVDETKNLITIVQDVYIVIDNQIPTNQVAENTEWITGYGGDWPGG